METWSIGDEDIEWKILGATKRTQAAFMTLRHGQTEGGPDNRHEKSDQWMYVLAGSGEAVVNRKKITLRKGMLLLIEVGEAHTIKAGPRSVLRTVNFYGPPVDFEES